MDTTQQLSDRAVLRSAEHDTDQLGVLVRRYGSQLYNFVYRFVGDRETAEDIVQETFLRCLRHKHQYPAIEQVSTWLYTIAGNLAKTELRRRKRWHWVAIGPSDDEESRAPFFEPVASGLLPGEFTDAQKVQASVVNAIGDLPSEFRKAVQLRDLDGLSYDEIAKIIDCPVGTVKSRVNRGRLRLQKRLRNLADEFISGLTPSATVVPN
jgi:RNA polymerase sigma-70 factor (ECF subfamily)